jgi:hypothetical protein
MLIKFRTYRLKIFYIWAKNLVHMIDEKIVLDYIELHDKIEKFFEGGVERKRFIEALGMTRGTFKRKLVNKTMLSSEMLTLVREINNLKV